VSVLLVYTLRPNNTALWLPEKLTQAIGARRGDKLTEKQFRDVRVQDLLRRRLECKTEPPLQ
jgi:hypothetical protein